jgi:hypothetical protein
LDECIYGTDGSFRLGVLCDGVAVGGKGDMTGKPALLKNAFVSKVVSFDPSASVDDLLANPQNPKIHPDFQQQSLAGAIDAVGFADVLKVNLRTSELWGADRNVQTMLDGHARVKILMRSHVEKAPVLYLDLTPDEEKLFLLSYDPLASMAVNDRQMVDELLHQVNSDDERVQQMLAEIAEREGISANFLPNKTPDFSSRAYTDDDIRDNPEMEAKRKNLMEVICPGCSSVFYVDPTANEKYNPKKS